MQGRCNDRYQLWSLLEREESFFASIKGITYMFLTEGVRKGYGHPAVPSSADHLAPGPGGCVGTRAACAAWAPTTRTGFRTAGSYAELFSQKAVDVFVSHWWGHEFKEFVMALEHAAAWLMG